MIKKKSVGIIGCGNWGKKVILILKKISNIKYICNSKDDYRSKDINVDWVFILTPNNTHYSIVKFFLNKKINVFCEKPLTPSLNRSRYLFNLAHKKNVKLYVDDIENFKNKKLSFSKKKNKITRKKKGEGSVVSLLYRLSYHDFYLLYDNFKNKKINITSLIKKKYLLMFEIKVGKKFYEFIYDINSQKKIHLINYINFNLYTNNPLSDMLNAVLYEDIDFNKNEKISLFANCLIDNIRRKYTL